MARIRTVKPEFFAHEGLASCSPHARLLAIALTQLADAEGRLRYIPKQIDAHAFPWEAEGKDRGSIQVLLGELEGQNYLKTYSVEGRDYIWIVNFKKHQRLTGKEAQSGSQLPEFPGESAGGNNGEASGCFPEKHLGAQERERERGTGIKRAHPAGADAEKPPSTWDIARGWLGGPLLGKTLKEHGDERVKQAIVETVAKNPADPKTYLLACLKSPGGPNREGRSQSGPRLSAVDRIKARNRQREQERGEFESEPDGTVLEGEWTTQ